MEELATSTADFGRKTKGRSFDRPDCLFSVS
jgi:hypothetical protein